MSQVLKDEMGLTFVSLIRQTVAGAVIGLSAVVFVISFTAILYNGDLQPLLSRGIGLALLGAAVMGAAGTLLFSFRGTICQPQDVTTVLLALAAARVAEGSSHLGPDALFATIATLVAITALVTGIALYLFGRLKLCFVARFIPYPVLGGLLAATGYLLTFGAIGMTLQQNVTIWDLFELFDRAALMRWLPWIAAGGAMVVVTRVLAHKLILPLSILAVGLGFYLILAARGLSLQDARDMGLLLGPFTGKDFVEGLDPSLLMRVDWWAIQQEAPIVITVASVAILGTLLNAISQEVATGQDLDLNKDLRGAGAANALSGCFGGLVGYHIIAETLLAWRMGLVGAAAGLSAAAACLIVLVFGAEFLSLLPSGLFAAVISFLGLDLLYGWLWLERRRLPLRDFAIVLLILVVAATIGFMEALAAGLVVAAMIFIFSYARIDFLRPVSSLRLRRSIVERSDEEADYLTEVGGRVAIFELRSFLFFGTANALLERVSMFLSKKDEVLDFIVLDFKHVQGLDASATFALTKIAEVCRQEGASLVISGMLPEIRQQYEVFTDPEADNKLLQFKSLDDALQTMETVLLSRRDRASSRGAVSLFLSGLGKRYPSLDLEQIFESVELADGDVLVTQGQTSRDIYVLQSGLLRAEVKDDQGNALVVARVLPGGIIGEVAYYGSGERSATLVAEGPAMLLMLTPDKLEGEAGLPPSLVVELHQLIASQLARRLIRMTKLLHQSSL